MIKKKSLTRRTAEFYLLAMTLVFLITLWLAAKGAQHHEIFFYALLGWPTAALFMLAANRYHRIRAWELQAARERA